MALIDTERDDAAILKAEDQAIADAAKDPQTDPSLEALIGILSDDPTPVHERPEGRDGPAR